ncbi:hypothetical protein A5630_25255 [Mycolicibacterium mucogenicum]|uniref:DUF7448 domain-containing protein n=1 Tax=Mycolicibacterium mucogenicum TaxID=56689 RepID=A0A1A3GY12_MYCMU|nr:hypothetical protein [Mycolicibacterium mucogenicum]OBJ40261.1 hypothetical protein A5630_25255 [Mycolicibacterium mucogenicum]
MSWYIKKEEIVGKKVLGVYISEEYLVLETDQGRVAFDVEGDCCSYSYFYDIVGADKLIANGPIVEVNELDLSEQNHDANYESIAVYGYEFVSEHPVWGEQTTVVSFRNASNGYYGGWMQMVHSPDRLNVNELQPVTGEFYEVEGR